MYPEYMIPELKEEPQYQPRRPEDTLCYQLVQENFESFFAERDAEDRPLPEFVKREFESYLGCGIPSLGFMRLKCCECEEERIVAFSCKKRGFCPSCCAKRMAESAAHLVDNVLPIVPYRQFVISFPYPLRFWMLSDQALMDKIHHLVISTISDFYKDQAISAGVKDPKSGSICFQQRFGSALNLNPHFHILFMDGVYTKTDHGLKFKKAEETSDHQVAMILDKISARIIAYLKKKGYLDEDGDRILNPFMDTFDENESSVLLKSHSICSKIAFGPNAGQYVKKIGVGFGFAEEIPLAKGKLCFSQNGFSLHAATRIKSMQRDQLEDLTSYLARGPISDERLEITPENTVRVELKSGWSDGTTHIELSPSEFIEKLASLVPPPRRHLVSWYGVLASASPDRSEIVLDPNKKKGFRFLSEGDEEENLVKNYPWAILLARVFDIDVSLCFSCGGKMKGICGVIDPDSAQRYLKSQYPDYEAASRSPPSGIGTTEEVVLEYAPDELYEYDFVE